MSNDEIQRCVEAFTAELTGVIHRAALDAVHQVLGEGSAPAAPRKRGRPVGSGAKAATAGKPATVAKVSAKSEARKPGEKRDPKVLEALVEKLFGYIKAHPDQRIEPISEALGIATRDLALPVKKLFRAKRITSKGQKRATTYAAAGSSSGGTVPVKPKKTAAKKVAKTAAKKVAKTAKKKVVKVAAKKIAKTAKKVAKTGAKKVAEPAVEVKTEKTAAQ
jgi:hypothetical protein